jgi:WhiB family redox-sensing transcriptional regulator
LFFPVGTTGQALLQISRAKDVCCECPVKVDCLDFAMETNQDTGIWGGTSEEERRQMRREVAARARAARLAANNSTELNTQSHSVNGISPQTATELVDQ